MKIESAEFILSAMRRDQFPRDGMPQVAFTGRSNVGKSSLMNRLLSRKQLARTGSTPGRTRAVNFFLVNRRFYFVDLPGYGFAKASRRDRERWAELMNEYFSEAGPRKLLVQLIDTKVGATELDRQGFEYFVGLDLRPLVVATKIDKVPRSKRARQLAKIRDSLELERSSGPVTVSAVSGEGVAQVWKQIIDFLDNQH